MTPVPLHQLLPGQSGRVVALQTGDAARLDRLGAYGLVPGCQVRLLQASPALIFVVEETEIAVDQAVAAQILVQVG